jgi:hypothetical protein
MEAGNQKSGNGDRKNAMSARVNSDGSMLNQPQEHKFTIHKEGAKPVYIKDLPHIHPAIADTGV